jgi:SET domain-containing protein
MNDAIQRKEEADAAHMVDRAIYPPMAPHLEVKTSLIPNAGKGLFTNKKIRKDSKIGKYRGTSYPSHPHLPRERRPYLVYLGAGGVRDGFQMNNHMRWINHKKHRKYRDPYDDRVWLHRDASHPDEPNAWLELNEDKTVYVKANRDIEAGEEIYIDYGYDPTVPDVDDDEAYILLDRQGGVKLDVRTLFPWLME